MSGFNNKSRKYYHGEKTRPKKKTRQKNSDTKADDCRTVNGRVVRTVDKIVRPDNYDSSLKI